MRDETPDDTDDLPEPEDLVGEGMTQLQVALDALGEPERALGKAQKTGWQKVPGMVE